MKIAICPGTFDPVTKGHVDIFERSCKLFDKVYAVVMINPTKSPVFSTKERVELIKKVTKHIPNLEVESYTGLVADYAREKNAHTIIKGLRAVTDFEDEFQQALTNKKLNGDLETMFMVTNQNYMYLSSTIVRQIAGFGGDITEFVHPDIKEEILARFEAQAKANKEYKE